MMWTKHTPALAHTHICRKHQLMCTVVHISIVLCDGVKHLKIVHGDGGESIWRYSKVDGKRHWRAKANAPERKTAQNITEKDIFCDLEMGGRPNKSKCMKYYTSRTQYIYLYVSAT